MSTNEQLMEQCRKEAPYKVVWRSDCHVPTYVIHGGPVHIAAFWGAIDNAENECNRLNAVHAAALYAERSKPRTGLPVEEVMEVVAKWDIDTLYWNDTAKAQRELRERLTAKLNTNDTTP